MTTIGESTKRSALRKIETGVVKENGNGAAISASLGLPKLEDVATPSIEELRAQGEEIKNFNQSAVKKISDAVYYIAATSKLSGVEHELARPHVEGLQQMIEKALAVEHPLVREETCTAYAVARIGCCDAERDAIEGLVRELRNREILKEESGIADIRIWGKTYRPLLKESNAEKLSAALRDLVSKASNAHVERLKQDVDALLKRGKLKPSDLLAGKIGLAGFFVPGKNLPHRSLPSGWLLVELIDQAPGKVGGLRLRIVGAEGGIKKYAKKIVDRGLELFCHTLEWEMFSPKFEDREKEEMLCALHDWFRRGLAYELAQRSRQLGIASPVPVG